MGFFDLIVAAVVIILVLFLGMLILASPILILLSFDKNHYLERLWYMISFKEQNIQRSLDKNQPAYARLTLKQKKEFHWRAYHFLATTDFAIKFKGDHQKIKTIIAFAAAQISMGLAIQSFDMYSKIIVYEDDYYSFINQRFHKGEVNPGAGIIVFSWNSILIGLQRSDDGINLLLHEFAHALRLEHMMMDYDVFNDDHFIYLDNLCKAALEDMRAFDNHFFRKYAAANIDEFFAVASESFFERPAALQTQMPELYNAFKKLYNHDPLTPNIS